ncbi:hypothetical protein EDD18DRAFT_832104 [Armillaria luteobubalina]|uniref:Uncharacterized protein n=1 Tax=Armillaria luteobubalina TaxID=153913 RepID=A0AA39QCS1_9AGAR|nr:hypothetical protein EDD18DRAFT_658540 [Armillaria luteobubalina]KAK0500527.1 hypothetical protein EDD18DRAFT_832104 [Armillaria luteobubalina]
MPMVPMGPPGTMPHMVPMPPMSTGIPIPQPTVFVQPESRSSSESYSSPRSARSRRSQSGSPRSGRSRSRTRSRRSRSPSRSLTPPPPVMMVSRGPHAMQPIIVPGPAPLPVLGQPFLPTAPVIVQQPRSHSRSSSSCGSYQRTPVQLIAPFPPQTQPTMVIAPSQPTPGTAFLPPPTQPIIIPASRSPRSSRSSRSRRGRSRSRSRTPPQTHVMIPGRSCGRSRSRSHSPAGPFTIPSMPQTQLPPQTLPTRYSPPGTQYVPVPEFPSQAPTQLPIPLPTTAPIIVQDRSRRRHSRSSRRRRGYSRNPGRRSRSRSRTRSRSRSTCEVDPDIDQEDDEADTEVYQVTMIVVVVGAAAMSIVVAEVVLETRAALTLRAAVILQGACGSPRPPGYGGRPGEPHYPPVVVAGPPQGPSDHPIPVPFHDPSHGAPHTVIVPSRSRPPSRLHSISRSRSRSPLYTHVPTVVVPPSRTGSPSSSSYRRHEPGAPVYVPTPPPQVHEPPVRRPGDVIHDESCIPTRVPTRIAHSISTFKSCPVSHSIPCSVSHWHSHPYTFEDDYDEGR